MFETIRFATLEVFNFIRKGYYNVMEIEKIFWQIDSQGVCTPYAIVKLSRKTAALAKDRGLVHIKNVNHPYAHAKEYDLST